jgi:signal transduction histidine kinase
MARRFLPASVRGQAVLATAAAMTTFGVAIAMASYILVSQVALSSEREVLSSRVADVNEQIGDRGLSGEDSLDLGLVGQSNPVLVQVVSPSGTVLASSPGLSSDLSLCPPTLPVAVVQDTLRTTVKGVETSFLRMVEPVSTANGDVVVCAVVSDSSVARAQSAVLLSLLLVLPLVIAGVCLAVWLSVGRALRAVDDLRGQAESFDRSSGGTLRVQETGDEVERLGRTLNSLLEDLHHQSMTTRQFVADAGHELRNPLTTLRVSLEFGSEADTAGLRQSVSDALTDLDRLEVLVQDLLALARTDAMDDTTHFTTVDLASVVLGAVDGIRRSRPDVDLDVDVDPCLIEGDESGLRSLVVNLINNASRHAVHQVRVTLRVDKSGVRLNVDDDGLGLKPGDCARVFDRFVRLDEARVRDEGGSGLGLAIVESCAVLHGGSASARPGPGGHFEVFLPTRPVPRPTSLKKPTVA